MYVSENVKKIFGYTAEEFISGKIHYEKCINPDDLERVVQEVITFTENGSEEFRHEPYRIITKDGSEKIINDLTFIERDNSGEILFFRGVVEDIAERNRVEVALKESEERYRRLVENACEAIYRMKLPSGEYEYMSPVSERIFGFTPEEFYDSPLLIKTILHPDWLNYFKEKWDRLLVGDVPDYYEYTIIDKNGNEKWLHQSNVLVKDSDDKPIAIEGIVSDITKLKLAEKREHDALTRMKMVMENAQEHIWELDLVNDQGSFNESGLILFGYDSDLPPQTMEW